MKADISQKRCYFQSDPMKSELDMRSALVCGAGGFIGSHLARRLKHEGFWVRGVDLKFPEFAETEADDFVIDDLRDPNFCDAMVDRRFDEVYQLAADMGGAGYLFIGDNDADIMHNSATINLHMLDALRRRAIRRVFYALSACVYSICNQEDPDRPNCAEDSVYPAAPDSEYRWEKLFSERLYLAYQRNHNIAIRIARYHNIFGPEGPGPAARKRFPPRFAGRSPRPTRAVTSKFGVTASRRDRFFTSTSASRERSA
jgi:GDP-D-mannose 3',5'-epimerase